MVIECFEISWNKTPQRVSASQRKSVWCEAISGPKHDREQKTIAKKSNTKHYYRIESCVWISLIEYSSRIVNFPSSPFHWRAIQILVILFHNSAYLFESRSKHDVVKKNWRLLTWFVYQLRSIKNKRIPDLPQQNARLIKMSHLNTMCVRGSL